ncbi:MAG: helix-turn-helix domain-containing protein [Firmicutes bacterium]|nr:helix-turn-helix domain-containing protein [Bacillota bacterium]
MKIPKDLIQELKDIHLEKTGKTLSDEDAIEGANNLTNFAKLLLDCAVRDHKRKLQLQESPNGFHLPEGEYYNCFVCHSTVSGETSWYSRHGITCLVCKEALRKRVIPVSVMKNRDSWLAMWEVKQELGLHYSTIQKMIRTGELKARIIKNGKHDYFWVFLKKENELL